MSDPSVSIVRIALVGCGAIARAVHLPTLVRLPGVRVVAVVDPSADARRLAGSMLPAARQSMSLTEALRDEPGDDAADAVIICTPTPLLARTAIEALEAGRHVYVEKPLATDETSARSLHAAWVAARRLGVVGFNYRQHPLLVQARGIVRQGAIGDPVGIQGIFTARPAEMPAWKQDAAAGATLFDLASHHVDLVSWLLDDAPVQVSAQVTSRRTPGDTAVLACRFANGPVLQGTYSHDAAANDRLTLIGTTGQLVVDRMAGLGVEVTSGPRDRSLLRRLQRTIRDITGTAFARSRLVRPDAEPSFQLALDAFVQAVRSWPRSNAMPASLPSIDDGVRCASVLFAARASAGSGRWETVPMLIAPGD